MMNTMIQTATAKMSQSELALWRIEDLLYVRLLDVREGDGYAVFAADGTYLDSVDTLEEVMSSAKHYEMEVAVIN
ncbi:MAG: hypothetical protein OQJ97_13180 [Rhodospirillales bacterium]|nr:hypothetical protein [Rhodospirillales bacterium]